MLIPFDILYEGFCNRVRSSGKSESILQLIKKENNDKLRVKVLLEEEPDLYSLLERNIGDSFDRKDELKARKLWERGKEGNSLELLTESLSFCPLPESFDESVIRSLEPDRYKTLLKTFMECQLKENTENTSENLISQIFYDRGGVLFKRKRYGVAFRDFIRAWLLGYSKTLEMTYQTAVCYFENGYMDESKELLQCAAQHLRVLPMSNEGKSEWTMSIVKVLKAIEGARKQSQKKVQAPEGNTILGYMAAEDQELTLFSSLLSQESEKIKGTSDTVELKHSPEKGRHMVAKMSIPPGATIIAEMPYAWATSKSAYHKMCAWCLQRVYSGIPCATCASAIFCDAQCRKQAMDSFHGKECKVLKLVDSSQKLGNMSLLCFRTLLITPVNVAQEYIKFYDDDTTIPQQVFMGLNEDGKLDSSTYLSVFSQTPNSEQRNAADLLKRTFSAIYLTLCLKYIGYFKEDNFESSNQMSEREIGVAALFLRHLQGASCNAYGINYVEKKSNYATEEEDYKKNLEIEEIGGATYPVISTTNHSCNPNVYRINIPGRMCLVKTLREIGEGEEILDCYGPLYLTEARQERMSKLQAQYLFRCNCPPCSENWPSYGNLRKSHVRYKCSSCGCEMRVEGKQNNKVKCPYCDKVTDMKKLQGSLTTIKDRFSMAKTSILGEAFQPFDKDMEAIITDYIKICQVAYLDPCFETVEAQEFLKLFWNISIRNS